MKELIEKYGTNGTVAVGDLEFPIINIPMMSDERWHELARENAVHNFIRQNGREPESVEAAVEWQGNMIMEMDKGAAI